MSSNALEPKQIFSFGNQPRKTSEDEADSTLPEEKRKKGTKSAPYSRRRIGILSVLFSPLVGALMLADNFERLDDPKAAKTLRLGFLFGLPVFWVVSSFVMASADKVFGKSDYALTSGSNFALWFGTLVLLDSLYRNWHKEWIAKNGEIVSGNGSGRAWLYTLVAIGFIAVFRVLTPSVPVNPIVSLLSVGANQTFTDGTFSISYPNTWEAVEITNNPNCGQLGFECVQLFNFARGSGALAVTRNVNLIDRLAPLTLIAQANWNNLQALDNLNSVREYESMLDGYVILRHDFTFTDKENPSQGALIVAKTDSEVYIMIAVARVDHFPQLEKALATIQLDANR
jgi:hypothetical protein